MTGHCFGVQLKKRISFKTAIKFYSENILIILEKLLALHLVAFHVVNWKQHLWPCQYLCHFPPPPLPPFFSVISFLMKVDWSTQKPRSLPLPDPIGYFGAPCGHFGFSWQYCVLSGSVFKVVRRCRWWVSAPGIARLVFIIFSDL